MRPYFPKEMLKQLDMDVEVRKLFSTTLQNLPSKEMLHYMSLNTDQRYSIKSEGYSQRQYKCCCDMYQH